MSSPSAAAAPLPGWVCAVIGGVSGTIEVCVNQPTVSWKNALQQGRPISFSPAVMYRGTLINATSIAPITAIQFGVAGMLTEMLTTGGQPLSHAEKIGTSLAGGAVSALVVCPADMLIIQQQKTGLALPAQVSAIAREYGWGKFSKGLLPAIGRESLFTGGYLGLAPVLRSLLVQYQPDTFAEQRSTTGADDAAARSDSSSPRGNMLSLLASSLMAGVTAGVLTHPIDTIKTRMQGDLSPDSPYSSIRPTARLLWQEGGLGRFYQGVLPRTGRICVAVLIFNECNRVFSDVARKAGF